MRLQSGFPGPAGSHNQTKQFLVARRSAARVAGGRLVLGKREEGMIYEPIPVGGLRRGRRTTCKKRWGASSQNRPCVAYCLIFRLIVFIVFVSGALKKHR